MFKHMNKEIYNLMPSFFFIYVDLCKCPLTFITSAFPAPQEANTAHLQLLTTGRVIVTRDGGGLGESDIGAITLSFS